VKIFSRIEDQVVEKDRGERIGDVRRLEGEEKAASTRCATRSSPSCSRADVGARAQVRHGGGGDPGGHEAHRRDAARRDLIRRSTSRRFRVEDKKVNERPAR
jgi:DNA-directed RNA polymerase subunit beta